MGRESVGSGEASQVWGSLVMDDKKKLLLEFECGACGEKVKIYRSRHFRVCGCGKSNGDSGDGYYYRLGGEARGAYWHGKEEAEQGSR